MNRAVVIFESLRWQSGGVGEIKDTLQMPNLPVFCVHLKALRGECHGGFKSYLPFSLLPIRENLRAAMGKSPILIE